MCIKVSIQGADGKMGIAIANAISCKKGNVALIAKITRVNVKEKLTEACKKSDVIIDFSAPNALKTLIAEAIIYKTHLVIGTTGYTKQHFSMLEQAATKIPILYSPNISLGANLLADLAKKTSQILKEYDIEILDFHHKSKKDSPSGTALMIANAINSIKKNNSYFSNIHFSSIRAGQIIGQHDVLFTGDYDLINIKHTVFTRKAFAIGALAAAKWIIGKKAALYTMQDLFSL